MTYHADFLICTAAAIIGIACGIASWLACTQMMHGKITIITTGLNPPLLTGNIISVGISTILVLAVSFAVLNRADNL